MTRTAKLLAGFGSAAGLFGGLAAWSAIGARSAEALVPPDGRFIDVPGARLHYVDRGSGPAIVMVHGLGGQLRNFSYGLLDNLAVDHRVILVDRPGWGYSTATTREQPGIAAQGEIVASLIEALGLAKPLLVGHSLGGAVALALALAHPDLIGGLALIAPLTQPVDVPPEVFRRLVVPPALRRVMGLTFAIPLGQLTSPATLKEVFAPEPVPDNFQVRGGGALSLRPKSFVSGSFELSVARAEAEALASRYGEITMPTSILFGREDHLLEPELHGARTAAAIPNAQFELVDGGHMIPVTQPALTLAWLRAAARG